ncbi:MAG: ABC transporter permease subunit [Lachnospiraceae bacterium]|nr:ABC transporter permease subunit [Lachnospiraceae bacterium]
MINLLSGEFYKLQKSKSIYVCSIVMIAFVLFFYGSLVLVDKIQQGEVENDSMGVVVSGEAMEETEESATSIFEQIGILDALQQMFGAFSGIFTAIFAAIFVYGEYGNGAIKNVTGKGYGRWKIFSSKYLMTIIASILIMIVMIITTLLFGVVFKGTEELNGEFCRNLCSYTAIELLLGAAFVGLVITINEFCRSLGAGIAISICIICFSDLITMGFDLVLKYFHFDFKVSDYCLLSLMANCPKTNMDENFAVRTIVTAVLWIVFTFGIGALHFQKADIK